MIGTIPTAEQFARANERRERRWVIAALLVAFGVGTLFASLGSESPLILLLLLGLAGWIVMLWRSRAAILYLAFISTCLFELFPTTYPDASTDLVPIFWNVNTIFQHYARMDAKAAPVNLFELLLLLAGLFSLIQNLWGEKKLPRFGPLFVPIAFYISFVALGWMNGMATGGDLKISLQEIRSQFYFLAAYLMAVNLADDPRQVTGLLWTTTLCIGVKGAIYTYRRWVTLAGAPLPDQGVGSHEEAFLFDAFMLLLATLSLYSVRPHLRGAMWLLMPLVILGDLATNRRAATASLIIAVPILLLAAHRALPPRRRRGVALFAAVLVIGTTGYYMSFRDSSGTLALPARAIRSQFEPDPRDASSNAYREAENADQMATIRYAPVLGYGYGKPFLHAVPIVDISSVYEWWDILPHNQILWVWMRTGTFGFLAFWMMIGAIVIRACQVIRDEEASLDTRALATFALLMIAQILIFGLLDLQLSNFRDMLFVGFWTGVLANLSSPRNKKREERA